MKIAIIGAGVMGAAFAQRFLSEGWEVVVWNRSREKLKPLLDAGAAEAGSPADAASVCNYVLSSVTNDEALIAVTLEPHGTMMTLPESAVHIDTSTVSPGVIEKIHGSFGHYGGRFVHAPVLGSRKQILAGELLTFASGCDNAIASAHEALQVFSKQIWTFSQPAKAANLKLACNLLIASMIGGLSQSLAFGVKNGVEPSLLLEIIQNSALSSPMFTAKGKQITEQNWQANFTIDNLIKDLSLALEAGTTSKTPLPLASILKELFVASSVSGYGSEDYSAVSKQYMKLAGLQLEA